MQNRFNEFNSAVIPQTFGRYTVSIDGNIFDHSSNTVLPLSYEQEEPFINFTMNGEEVRFKLATLVAIFAKDIRIPIHLWKFLDVQYIDGNKANFHPRNTVWKFPEDGLKINDESEFRYIPGFSRYSVNRQGGVYSLVSEKMLSPYIDQMGYWIFGMTPDVGNRTIIGRHRAIALAFLPYPPTVDKLDVNHKDGVKNNNLISNLEWATRKMNCDHAYSSGLRSDNLKIDVRNAYTGEVVTYYSICECARQFNLNDWTIGLRVKTRGQKTYGPGYQFKLHDDELPWNEVDDPLQHMRECGVRIQMSATNLSTNQTLIFNTMSELASYLGATSGAINYHMPRSVNKCVFRNHLIGYITLEENN